MKEKYSKKDIIKILYISANKYKQNLLDKNIMFVFEEKETQQIKYIETIFNDYNFLHLTGLKYTKGASAFYNDCINSKISPDNIEIKNIAFTKMKLDVLENIMSINKSAKKIGTYNNNKLSLKIEKVVGNIHCSLGFSNIKQNDEKLKYYYPKTLLQEEFKKNVNVENKIIAIFSKEKTDELYGEITFLGKNSELNKIFNEKGIKRKIDYSEIQSENVVYMKKIKKYIEEK